MVPHQIKAIAYQNKALLYDMLFKATAQTLRTIAADPKHLGAEIGFIANLEVNCARKRSDSMHTTSS